MAGPAIGGELALEGVDLLTQDVATAAEGPQDGAVDLALDAPILSRKIEEGDPHGRADPGALFDCHHPPFRRKRAGLLRFSPPIRKRGRIPRPGSRADGPIGP